MTQYQKKTLSFLFYDYETFGIHTALDKPAQFACIRTNLNFELINDSNCFYCFPSDDYFPDPSSVLITHITPQYTHKHGTNEYNFSKKIFNIFKKPNTCIIGYNNINFDDEITRNIFYRNFFDPYEWSWKNQNSRWDILLLLRACYALRPNGIKWPINTDGLPSFTLSALTKINNITHVNAHDAMSDVYATIEMAKLVKKKQPKLFNFFFKNRHKQALYTLINLNKFKPLVYVSNYFGAIRNNISFILPIIWHKNNNNILISIDLFNDIKKLIVLCKTISFEKTFIKDLFNYGIVLLHLNRCPMIAPIQVIREKDFNRLKLNNLLYKDNINLLKKNKWIAKNIQSIFSQRDVIDNSLNVDLQIYNDFFNIHDRKRIEIIRHSEVTNLKKINFQFNDTRLNSLFFRYRARNFFDTLNCVEKKQWLKHCLYVLNPIDLIKYKDKIECLLHKNSLDTKKVLLLNDLLNYIFQKHKNLLAIKSNLN